MLSPGGGCGIVRHHEDGGRLRGRSCGHDARHSTGAFGELGEPVENGRGGGDVEGGRGLIREDDVRAGGQNAGDGHTLTLTTAQLMWKITFFTFQTNKLNNFWNRCFNFMICHSSNFKRKSNIFENRSIWQKFKILKDHTNSPSQKWNILVSQFIIVNSTNYNLAASLLFFTSEHF